MSSVSSSLLQLQTNLVYVSLTAIPPSPSATISSSTLTVTQTPAVGTPVVYTYTPPWDPNGFGGFNAKVDAPISYGGNTPVTLYTVVNFDDGGVLSTVNETRNVTTPPENPQISFFGWLENPSDPLDPIASFNWSNFDNLVPGGFTPTTTRLELTVGGSSITSTMGLVAGNFEILKSELITAFGTLPASVTSRLDATYPGWSTFWSYAWDSTAPTVLTITAPPPPPDTDTILQRLNSTVYTIGFSTTIALVDQDRKNSWYSVSVNGEQAIRKPLPIGSWNGDLTGAVTLSAQPNQEIEVVVNVAKKVGTSVASLPLAFTTLSVDPLVVFNGYAPNGDGEFTIVWKIPDYDIDEINATGFGTSTTGNPTTFTVPEASLSPTLVFNLKDTSQVYNPIFYSNTLTLPPFTPVNPLAPVNLGTPAPLPSGVLTCVANTGFSTTAFGANTLFIFPVSPFITPDSVITATLQGGTATLEVQASSWIVSAKPSWGFISVVLAYPLTVGNIDVSYHCSSLNGNKTSNTPNDILSIAPIATMVWGSNYIDYNGVYYGTQLYLSLTANTEWSSITSAPAFIFNIYENGILRGRQQLPVAINESANYQLRFILDYVPRQKGSTITVDAINTGTLAGITASSPAFTSPPFRLVSPLELYNLVTTSPLFQFASYLAPAINGAPPIQQLYSTDYLVSVAVVGNNVVVTCRNPNDPLYIGDDIAGDEVVGYFGQSQATITFRGTNGHTFSEVIQLTAPGLPASVTPVLSELLIDGLGDPFTIPLTKFQPGQNYTCRVRVDNAGSIGTQANELQLSNILEVFISNAAPPQPLTFTATPSGAGAQPSVTYNWTVSGTAPIVGNYTIRQWELIFGEQANSRTITVPASATLSTTSTLVLPGRIYYATLTYTSRGTSAPISLNPEFFTMPALTDAFAITNMTNVGYIPTLPWFATFQLTNASVNASAGIVFTVSNAGGILTTTTMAPAEAGLPSPWIAAVTLPAQEAVGSYTISAVATATGGATTSTDNFVVSIEAPPPPPTNLIVNPTETTLEVSWVPPAVLPQTFELYITPVADYNRSISNGGQGTSFRTIYITLNGTETRTTLRGGFIPETDYIAQIASANGVRESEYLDVFFTTLPSQFYIYSYGNGLASTTSTIRLGATPMPDMTAPNRPTLTNVSVRWVSVSNGGIFTWTPLPNQIGIRATVPMGWNLEGLSGASRPPADTYNVTVTGSISNINGGNPLVTPELLVAISYPDN